jgi:hypothetical protein
VRSSEKPDRSGHASAKKTPELDEAPPAVDDVKEIVEDFASAITLDVAFGVSKTTCDICSGTRAIQGSAPPQLCPPCSRRHLVSLSFSVSDMALESSSPPIIVTLPSKNSLAQVVKHPEALDDMVMRIEDEFTSREEKTTASFEMSYGTDTDGANAYGGLWQQDTER